MLKKRGIKQSSMMYDVVYVSNSQRQFEVDHSQ
jgi:hypothetical protein